AAPYLGGAVLIPIVAIGQPVVQQIAQWVPSVRFGDWDPLPLLLAIILLVLRPWITMPLWRLEARCRARAALEEPAGGWSADAHAEADARPGPEARPRLRVRPGGDPDRARREHGRRGRQRLGLSPAGGDPAGGRGLDRPRPGLVQRHVPERPARDGRPAPAGRRRSVVREVLDPLRARAGRCPGHRPDPGP